MDGQPDLNPFHDTDPAPDALYSQFRGIYSDQFAELGMGNKNQPLKKEGKKSARGTTIRQEKEGK